MIAADSSILADILIGHTHADSSQEALGRALAAGPVVVCEIVIAELSSGFSTSEGVLDVIADLGILFSPIVEKSAVRAGEMQRRYHARGGRRQRTVPDFLIGAHAMLQCDGLVTRDAGFFRDYFKGLRIIAPRKP